MQEATTVASQQPGAAAVQIAAGPTTAAQTIAIPQSVQEIEGLRSRRSELVDQLNRASNRRGEVLNDMRDASNAERAGLEQRLTALDSRMVQIEADIAATERALTNASPAMLGAAAQAEEAAELARRQAEPPIDEDAIAVMGFIAMFLMIPIVIAHTRRIWKRPQPARALPPATEGRLERIEQAVEAIAVEVERVSEGQRFVTKLMSETKEPARMLPESRGSL
jgi:DNA repair exonuclease SbcCD ATPase subunit